MSPAPHYLIDAHHRLQAGPPAAPVDHTLRTPNLSGALAPRAIVLHYTGGGSALGSARWLCDRKARASAHLVIERDGRIWQLAPCNVKTWHAGKSTYQQWSMLNDYAIGIEMANYGWDTRKAQPGTPTLHLPHRLERTVRAWEVYPAAQVAAVAAVCAAIRQRYPSVQPIIGHDDIAPKRKRDPGPAWDWPAFRAALAAYPGVHHD